MVLVAIGCAARSCRAAVDMARELGMKVGLIRPVTVWPFPRRLIAQYASLARRIVVVELNQGQMILEVQRIVAGKDYGARRRLEEARRPDPGAKASEQEESGARRIG